MPIHIKQFVPSSVCLQCDGCCRFQNESSEWRPRVAMEEKVPSFFVDDDSRVYSGANVDVANYLKATSCQEGCRCVFLKEDNYCSIYDQRPFECGLYPFLISRGNNGIVINAHLSCPYVQEKYGTQEFEEYVAYLKKYLTEGQDRFFLIRNLELAGDYKNFKNELVPMFGISESGQESPWDEELIHHKKEIVRALESAESSLSCCHFSQIALWQEHFNFYLNTIDDHLCMFATNHLGSFLYLPPLSGKISEDVIEKCFEVLDDINHGSGVSRIENVSKEQLAYFHTQKYDVYERGKECCYDREELAQLQGNKYKSKRNDLNQFLKNNVYEYASYETTDKEACLGLLNEWVASRQQVEQYDIAQSMLIDVCRVQQMALANFQDLDLIGRVVRVDGEVRAFTFGYAINDESFCVLFETADLTIKGLAVYIFHRFVNDPQIQPFKIINVMDDFCADNVNQAKESYRPSHYEPVYTVSRK